MFEFYARNINPDDPDFQAFIEHYLMAKDNRSPAAIPYSQLYATIKEALGEYIQKTKNSKRGAKK
jgi:hypothetical protein